MNRAELRLELLRITHHHGRSHTQCLEIARDYEAQYFADVKLDGEGEDAEPAAAGKGNKKGDKPAG
ncbi:MAG: hypothetical protein BroJett013_07230 [Alphaproteobacteria bacterium]|nr:MAG: hypothetical protein BroJett013_07230 [Alphaproteobacteria bacterium]